MKSKTKKIIYIIIIILAITSTISISGLYYYNHSYLDKTSNIKLSLIGEENITLNLLDEYTELGAKATFRNEDISDNITIDNKLDTSILGTYDIIYNITYKNKTETITRHINIIDTIKPEIKLNGDEEITVYLNEQYIEQGAIATDNYDGDITDKIEINSNVDTSKEGTYEILYTIKDSSNNESSIKRTVTIKKRPLIHHDGVAVLNYHFFYDKEGQCNYNNCISIHKFEEQLIYLEENGYTTLTMEQFRAYMYGEINIPEKSVLITIDDGAYGTGKHNGNYLIPMLEKHQAHATLFLITGWWDIDNYRSPYLDIESHTNDMHTENYCQGVSRGAKILCLTHDEVIEDLKKSISITGSTKAFCYPFYAYNGETIEQVKEAGFQLAFAGGNYKATKYSNKYAIPRYQILKGITMDQFIRMIY